MFITILVAKIITCKHKIIMVKKIPKIRPRDKLLKSSGTRIKTGQRIVWRYILYYLTRENDHGLLYLSNTKSMKSKTI